MRFIRNLRLRPKLMVTYLLVGLLPFAAVAGFSYYVASSSLQEQAFSGLTAIGQTKQTQVVEHLRDQLMAVNIFAHEPMVKDSVSQYSNALKNGLDSPEYEAVDKKWHGSLSQVAKRFGWADIYIVDLEGNVVFSNLGRSDLGVNLNESEELKDTDLALAYTEGIEGVLVGDLKYYEPLDQAVGFVSHRIFGPDNEVIGVFVAAYSADEVSLLVASESGMGETGVIKLVGQDHHLRSNIGEQETVKGSIKDDVLYESRAIDEALNEKSGTALITNEKGVNVLASWQPVLYRGARWAMVAEIEASEALAPIRSLGNTLAASGAIAALVILLFSFYVSRSMARPIIRTMFHLKASSDRLEAASNRVSNAGAELSGGVREQTTSLEEASTVLNDVSMMTQANTENAGEANNLAQGAKKSAVTGEHTVNDLEDAMSNIKYSSKEIEKIIKVIEEIAFQTNLLALNAAVEAARAGEHGRGFAVVADEVRSLATRAGEAAKETRSLILSSTTSVDKGVTTGKQVEEVFEEISERIGKVAQYIADISRASQDQATGVATVSSSVKDIQGVTERNAVAADDSASAAHALLAQSQDIDVVLLELEALIGAGEMREFTSERKGLAAPAFLKNLFKRGNLAQQELDSATALEGTVQSDDALKMIGVGEEVEGDSSSSRVSSLD